jgi:hypothetical protein
MPNEVRISVVDRRTATDKDYAATKACQYVFRLVRGMNLDDVAVGKAKSGTEMKVRWPIIST